MFDLRSDSVTKPTQAMRRAAKNAKTDHDGFGNDPTVEELEERAADLLGLEASIYLPSGTMANQVALRTHTSRGQEVICEEECHIYNSELSGLSELSNLLARPVDGGPRGIITPQHIENKIRVKGKNRNPTGVVALENTHNYKGGTAISPQNINETAKAANENGIPVHLDGARLFRAAAARNCDVNNYSKYVDSIYIDLAKIGAPVGVLLAGPKEFIADAVRARKLFGGHMKQSGIIAAPGIVALENIGRLKDDNDKAATIYHNLRDETELLMNDPETNILLLDPSEYGIDATILLEKLKKNGVHGITVPGNPERVRLCTHRDIDVNDLNEISELIIETTTAL